MRIEDLGICIWIHKLLNVNIISISAEEYRIRLYKFKVDNKLIYLMIRNDLVNWWAIYVDYWSSNVTDREYIPWSLINLASHVVLLGRIQDISFSAYILQTISIIFVFFAPILTLNKIFSVIVYFLLSFRENKECIWFIDENHGFVFIALNFANLIVLQKIFNESRLTNLADLFLL